MSTSKAIRAELLKKMKPSTLYGIMERIKEKTGNSISNEIAIDVVAAQNGINVYRILKKEGRATEVEEFRKTMANFNFNSTDAPQKKIEKPKIEVKKPSVSPYDFPIKRYQLDKELELDCKLEKPYRHAVKEALLTLETRMRSKLNLDEADTGKAIILKAKSMGLFARKVAAEEEGLFMLYAGAMQWLRNPANHKKVIYSKEDALKIILFTDYLIRLFEDLHQKNMRTKI